MSAVVVDKAHIDALGGWEIRDREVFARGMAEPPTLGPGGALR